MRDLDPGPRGHGGSCLDAVMTLPEFHHALRILANLDETISDSANLELTQQDWANLTADPYRFFLRCDEAKADRLFAFIQRRMNRHARAA
jgi:hypothetical protein